MVLPKRFWVIAWDVAAIVSKNGDAAGDSNTRKSAISFFFFANTCCTSFAVLAYILFFIISQSYCRNTGSKLYIFNEFNPIKMKSVDLMIRHECARSP